MRKTYLIETHLRVLGMGHDFCDNTSMWLGFCWPKGTETHIGELVIHLAARNNCPSNDIGE